MRRSLVLGAALILTLSLSACNNDNNTKDDTIHVESVSVASIHELEVGETFTVGTNTVTVLPDNATDKSYSLSSGDKDVFTTSGYVITAVGEGSATLTVTTTDGGFTDWTTITVKGDTEQEPDQGGDGGDDQPGTGGEGGGGEPGTGGEGGDGGDTGGEGGGTEPGPSEPDPGTELGTIELSFNSDTYTVTENDTVNATVTVSPTEASVTYKIDDTGIAYYTASDTGVTIHGVAAGNTTITATAELEGYTTATATASIVVEESVPENQDITITLNQSTYTITAGTSEKLDFTVSPEDDAISVNVTSLNTNFVSVSQQVDGWYIYGVAEGSTNVSITASGEGYNSATETVSVIVEKAPDVYTYEFKVANINEVPTDWKFDDEVTFVLQPQLLVYVNGTLSETQDLTANDVSVEPTDGSEIVTIDGLTISPKGVGTATISVTYTGGESLIGNSSVEFTISVAEDYSTAHKLSINTTDLATEVTVGGAGISLENRISLITETTALSTNTTTSDGGVTAQSSDVTIDVSGTGSLTRSGLTLTPSQAGEATVTVTWTAYASEEPAPTDSFTITVNPKAEDTYTMTITNKTELESAWYTEDGPRTISLSIVNDTTGEEANTGNDNITVTPETDGVVSVDGLTLTPVGKGTSNIYVEWTEHTEAHATFEVSVDEYTYSLSITNADDFAGTWSIEDGPKTLSIELSTNNPSLSGVTASQTNVSITGYEEGFTTTDGGFTLTPTTTGTYTITATWIGHTTATASITVTVDDTIKPVSITMDPSSLELEVGQPQTLTATVFGASGAEATNQGVEWSSYPTGIVSISGTGNTVTVTANEYAATTTITARSTADSSVYAECSVTTAEALETGAPIVLPQDKEVVVSSPDDNGVYVLGTEGFASYYETGTTTSSYDAATPVRVLAAEGGYNLMIDDQYLAVDNTIIEFKDDISEAAVFSISTTGIKYGDTALAINTDGELLISSIADAVYLVDIVLEETDSLATGGTFYLSCLVNGVRKYADGTDGSGNNLRLTTSTDTTNAIEFTIEEAGDDQYYIKRISDGYYLKLNPGTSSSNYVYFTSSSSGCELTYNNNGYWAETTNGKILAYNSGVGDGEISSYASSNTSYPAAQLYAVPSLPELKGITISAPEAELMRGGEEVMSYILYPTCYTALTLTWAATDTSGNVRNDVTFSGNGTIDIAGDAETSVVNITASYGDIVSNIAQITVTGISYIESESLVMSELTYTADTAILPYSGTLYTLDGAQGGNSSSSNYPHWFSSDSTFRVYNGNTLTFSLHEGVTYPIEKVEITYKSTSYNDTMTATTNVASSTLDSTVGTIVPTDGLQSFTVTGTATSRITKITVYYSQS